MAPNGAPWYGTCTPARETHLRLSAVVPQWRSSAVARPPELSSYQHTEGSPSIMPAEGRGGRLHVPESRGSAYPRQPASNTSRTIARSGRAQARRAGAQPNGEADRAPRLAPRPSALAAERRTLSLGGRQRHPAAVSAVDRGGWAARGRRTGRRVQAGHGERLPHREVRRAPEARRARRPVAH